MTSSICYRLCLCLSLASLVSACGNVRFVSGTSTSGSGSAAGTAGGTGGSGSGSGSNNGGLDGGAGTGGTTTGTAGGSTGGTSGGAITTPGPTPPSGPRQVTYSGVVPPASNQVDILLVVDNSSSMGVAQAKMASQMAGFATALSNLKVDWQMCMTVTTYSTIGGTCQPTTCIPNTINPSAPSSCYTSTCVGNACTGNCTGGSQYWGTSYPWQGYNPPAGASQYILKPGNGNNLATIFQNTVTAVGDTDMYTGDERGIKAAFNHFANAQAGYANATGCYRPGSAVAVILLSNEDERSVGGNINLLDSRDVVQQNFYNKYGVALDNQDTPSALLSQVQNTFGQGTRFTFNSIVTDNSTCQQEQDQPNSAGIISFSYIGNQYLTTSALTGGGTGSICSTDFSNTMNLFADQITQVNSMATFTLQCAPTNGSLTVKIDGNVSSAYTLNGATITFNPALVSNQKLDLVYDCAQ